VKTACLSFSRSGEAIAFRIRDQFSRFVECFNQENYQANLDRIFQDFEAVIFISSTGIATRLCAPYLKSKSIDPAIVVVDDLGKYAISLISGHLGGANELARKLADFLSCQAIITTASDNRGIEAVDLFAKKSGLIIEDLKSAKTITAMMVDGKRIGFYSLFTATINYPNLVRNHPEGCIFVDIAEKIDCTVPACFLRPRILHVGIGCRKGKAGFEILEAINLVFRQNNLSTKSIRSLATIELKKNEPGLHEACQVLNCDLKIYSEEKIASVQDKFETSQFVQETTGVASVCEPCAYLSGDELIVNKTVIDGITIAVSKSNKL